VSAPREHPAASHPPPRATDPLFDFEPKSLADLERQTDDIIAKFRARQHTGIEF